MKHEILRLAPSAVAALSGAALHLLLLHFGVNPGAAISVAMSNAAILSSRLTTRLDPALKLATTR